MLTPRQLGALGFAISRARAHTRDTAPQLAREGVEQAEDALQVLQAQLDADATRRREVLNKLHTVADHIEAAHPNGIETTLRYLREARELLARSI